MHTGRRLLTAALAAGVALTAATPAFAETVLTKLGTLPTATNSGAFGVNNSGVAVGWMNIRNYRLAVRWAPDGTASEIDRSAIARAISDSGMVAGEKEGKAARWAPDGTATLLPKVDTTRQICVARAVNDSGVAVGKCEGLDGRDQLAVRWDTDGTAKALPLSGDDTTSIAHGINSAGAIVGEIYSPTTGTRAVQWNPDGTVTDLTFPPGTTVYSVKPTGINGTGQVSGTAFVQSPGETDARTAAVRWDADGSVAVLPGLTPQPSQGNAISADGTVVGATRNPEGRDLAAKWAPDGTLTLLPTANPSDGGFADAINDNGVIAGLGVGSWAVRWHEQ